MFQRLTRELEGEYICKAVNKLGQKQVTYTVSKYKTSKQGRCPRLGSHIVLNSLSFPKLIKLNKIFMKYKFYFKFFIYIMF